MAYQYNGMNWDSPQTAYEATAVGNKKWANFDEWYASEGAPKVATAPISMADYADQRRPGYNPMYDQSTMSSLGYNYTPSRWLGMSQFKNDLEQQDQREKALRQSRGAASAAEDALAARGGLSSGARERVQEGAMKNYLGMAQDITRQGNINDLNMNITDMQSQQQAHQRDVQNQMSEIGRMNEFNKNVYDQQMEAEAADRSAADMEAKAREAERKKGRGLGRGFNESVAGITGK